MELIKKIKEAETQSQEIIENAKADAARQAERVNLEHRKMQAEAEQERKKAIKSATAAAQSQGLAEIENLKVQAEKSRQQLRNKAGSKMAGAVTKVINYLKG